MSVPGDKNDTKNKENEEDDWLAPPPKTLFRTQREEDSILRELRYNGLADSTMCLPDT